MACPTSSPVLLAEEDLQMELIREDSVDPSWPHLWDEGYTSTQEERECEWRD
jgi:hypothetical protein